MRYNLIINTDYIKIHDRKQANTNGNHTRFIVFNVLLIWIKSFLFLTLNDSYR